MQALREYECSSCLFVPQGCKNTSRRCSGRCRDLKPVTDDVKRKRLMRLGALGARGALEGLKDETRFMEKTFQAPGKENLTGKVGP